jgi:outer membrane lipoprotein-sorting protein
MKNYFISVLIITAAALFSFSFAQNDLLKSVQDKYTSATDISADFQKITNGKIDFSGKLFYKKGNKTRLEMNNLIIASDGKTIWNFNKRENKVIINEYDPSDPMMLSIENILFKFPMQSEVSSGEEKGIKVLYIKPKPGSRLNFNSAKLFLNKDNFVDSVLMEQGGNTITEIKFSNYRVNNNLDDSKFKISPPEGSTVIDLR